MRLLDSASGSPICDRISAHRHRILVEIICIVLYHSKRWSRSPYSLPCVRVFSVVPLQKDLVHAHPDRPAEPAGLPQGWNGRFQHVQRDFQYVVGRLRAQRLQEPLPGHGVHPVVRQRLDGRGDELVLAAHRQCRFHQVIGPVQGVGHRRCHVDHVREQGVARSIINGVCGYIVACVSNQRIHRTAHVDLLHLTCRMRTRDRSSCPGRIYLTLTRAIRDAHAVCVLLIRFSRKRGC